MADDTISVEVKDGIDKGIARGLSEIASQSRKAYQNVDQLIKRLQRVNTAPIDRLNKIMNSAQREMAQSALTAQRLATETNRTAQAATNAAAAEQRLAQATARTATAQQGAAASALRLEGAQARAAAAQDRATASQARATAAAQAGAQQLKANEAELERITGIHDRFDAVLARNPKAQQAFSRNLGETAKKAGLARHELQNFAYQVNDVVVSLGSGQKPLQVLLQQGAQIGQIFGTSGVGLGAIFRQLAGIVGGLVARLLPFAAVLTAVLAPFALFTREFNQGIDSKKLVSDLNLTEQQMRKLKKSGEDLKITFGDTFKATFQVLGKYLVAAFGTEFNDLKKTIAGVLNILTDMFSEFIRFALGKFLAFAYSVKAVFKDIPAAIELAAKNSINTAITIIEGGINIISKALSMSPMGQLLGLGTGSALEIKLPRLELSDGAKSVESDLSDALKNGFKDADKYVTQFGKDVQKQAAKNAQDRIKKAAGDPGKTSGAKGFDSAAELKKINDELDSQAKNMFLLSTARDAANRADEIAIRFAKEGKPLRDDEIKSIRDKIQALNDAREVQTQFDRIYQSVSGPQREYNASLTAADKLLKMGAISQAQYTAELARAKDQFDTVSDPLHQMNKELDEQIKLLNLMQLPREIEQQVLQAQNKALTEGKPLRDEEIKALREKLQLVQQLNIQSQITDDLQQNSSAQKSMNTQRRTDAAIGQIGINGFTGGDAVSALAQDNPALQATTEFAQAQLATYTDMYAQIEALRQADVISDQSAIAAKFQVFQQQSEQYLNAASTVFTSLTALQGSENKKQAAIGRKAAIAETVINTYKGATAAYSSLASIPYVGPILGAIAAGAAIAAGLANVQKIKSQGYQQGGYTGNLPVDEAAGTVHGREYVFDAPATSRIGVANLEALRRGRVPVQSLGRDEGQASSQTVQQPTNVGRGNVTYNQNVSLVVEGKRTRKTSDQQARVIRRETTKELSRSGA